MDIFPGSILLHSSSLTSSNSYEQYIAFIKTTLKLRRSFVRFYINKKYPSSKINKRNGVQPFINADENVFYSKSKKLDCILPYFILFFLFLGFLFLCLRRLYSQKIEVNSSLFSDSDVTILNCIRYFSSIESLNHCFNYLKQTGVLCIPCFSNDITLYFRNIDRELIVDLFSDLSGKGVGSPKNIIDACQLKNDFDFLLFSSTYILTRNISEVVFRDTLLDCGRSLEKAFHDHIFKDSNNSLYLTSVIPSLPNFIETGSNTEFPLDPKLTLR